MAGPHFAAMALPPYPVKDVRGSCSASACASGTVRRDGGLTPRLAPEEPEERREPAPPGVANHAHRREVVAHVLFGALLHSTLFRPGPD